MIITLPLSTHTRTPKHKRSPIHTHIRSQTQTQTHTHPHAHSLSNTNTHTHSRISDPVCAVFSSFFFSNNSVFSGICWRYWNGWLRLFPFSLFHADDERKWIWMLVCGWIRATKITTLRTHPWVYYCVERMTRISLVRFPLSTIIILHDNQPFSESHLKKRVEWR